MFRCNVFLFLFVFRRNEKTMESQDVYRLLNNIVNSLLFIVAVEDKANPNCICYSAKSTNSCCLLYGNAKFTPYCEMTRFRELRGPLGRVVVT